MKFLSVLGLLLVLQPCPLFAQDAGSLLELIKDTIFETNYVTNAFKSTRVVNGQSIEMLGAGSLDFRILHRFGPINLGAGELFGLDRSSIRFSFDYAPINNLLLGVGRSSAKKELDAFVKYRIVQQTRGANAIPVSIILLTGITCETLPFADPTIANYFTSRLGYFHQVIVGSKISDPFSILLSPTLIHRNFVDYTSEPHDIYALGFGARFKVTNRIAFTIDYYHSFTGRKPGVTFDPLAIGFDVETGGHVFQVHVSNSVGMNERSFITETYNNWAKGGIQLGFNISRIFQL